MTETIKTLLEPIQNRLNAATPGPWHWRNTSDVYLMGARTRVVMGFARMGMQGAQPQFVNEDGLFIDAGKENLHAIPDAAFIANAPTDQARLLAAVQAVAELPHEDYCCTKGCPGFGLATCGNVHKSGDECDGSECSCFMSGPLRAIESALSEAR
ncbi:hypothetical protein J2T10_000093 [Paenarthrobacter nicotinovorans]|uniref:Uncharacterized protein n=1 Tax=Paenarthrobacter nicotinovorans TaxID=29320 RepID=A0ABT9TFQ6_PAENI|nr:hypothetical protein [Paenarthrobacter nicotinovorans]MDQ0100474.1 hypothetical protein [Paenarthrobacter nicotinovorans]